MKKRKCIFSFILSVVLAVSPVMSVFAHETQGNLAETEQTVITEHLDFGVQESITEEDRYEEITEDANTEKEEKTLKPGDISDGEQFPLEIEDGTTDFSEEQKTAPASDFQYQVTQNEDGTDAIQILEYTGTENDLVIPEKIEGKPVTILASEVMYGSILPTDSEVTRITIPKTVRDIHSGTFDGYKIFPWANKLQWIEVSEDNPYYSSDDGVLYNKDKTVLWRVPIGKTDGIYSVMSGVEAIEGNAFYGCELEEIKIPASVQNIRSYGFGYAVIKKLAIPETVQKTGNWVLNSTKIGTLELCQRTVDLSVRLSEVDKLILTPSVEILNSFADIKYNGGVLEIPATVKEIKADAFLTLMDSVSAFHVADGNIAYIDHEGVLYDRLMKKLIAYPALKKSEVYKMPDTVETIPGFINIGEAVRKIYFSPKLKVVKNLKKGTMVREVVIPAGVPKIGESAFFGYANLEKVTLNKGLTEIGMAAFSICRQLKEVVIPEGVKEIQPSTFLGCENLRKVVIPRSVDVISDNYDDHFTRSYSGEPPFAYCPNVTIYGYADTCAERYAMTHNIPFQKLYEYAVKLTLDKKNITLVKGSNTMLKATVSPANTDDNVIWSSSDTSVVSVNNGILTAVKAGKAIITARAGNVSDSCQVVVNEVVTPPVSVVPARVKGVKVKQSLNAIKLSWTKQGGISGYTIYRYDSKLKKYREIQNVKSSAVSYIVSKINGNSGSKLKSGTAYTFKIAAYQNINNKKVYGDAVIVKSATKPSTPKIIQTRSMSSKKAVIKWKKVDGSSGYQLYMSVRKSSGYKLVKKINKSSLTSYTKTKLKKGKRYYFKLKSYKTVDKKKIYSNYSVIKSVKIK